MNFSVYRDKENIVKVVSIFLILIVFFLSAVFFVHGSKQPKNKWDGPYNASCVAERNGIHVNGWAKARGTGAVRNGYFMCSMGLSGTGGVDVDSRSLFDGGFEGRARYSGNTSRTLYADSSAWGSDKHAHTWAATVSDSAN